MMFKLLVNAPTGSQEIVEVTESGGYFDPGLVLWDERVDGPLPAITIGGMVRNGAALVLDAGLLSSSVQSSLAEARSRTLSRMDADVDALYASVVGNRAEEYRLAEEQALAFAAGGYAGGAPSSVDSLAQAKGWSEQQAADDIIATASQWRSAQASIRKNRLAIKEMVRGASDESAVNAAVSEWSAFLSAIRQALGL